ncbi:SDR family oxidoreductase [Massilia sp. METH4]|uniref:SDR family oxidoreductase n=1 Tax=Massilia sp. METH4 TaxID=3123041 RepID=UPI0030CBD5C9
MGDVSKFDDLAKHLRGRQYRWLVTGAAGFIGSNLVEALLKLGQRVTGLDNFATGHQHNLDQVRAAVGEGAWAAFHFVEGDIRDAGTCARACEGSDFVLHEAALGSVTRSLEDPQRTHDVNVTGFVNMLVAARDAKVRRFVYAASSSTYGDHPGLPKVEDRIGKPLSPYAVTKYVNELYADVFARCYGIEAIGLRYFNVFGPRQDPQGAYAAVIPQWVAAMIANRPVFINGDGETSRDFCFIDNVVQANLLAALATAPGAANTVYNVALNERTSLNQLYHMMRELLQERFPHLQGAQPQYKDFRAGDVRHSQADITRARESLGYAPTHDIAAGLREAMDWYVQHLASAS